ncbi:hypothetical protein KP729_000169|uniref:hypothetical protein n=1 Tax=Delftia acidovorans TaxID=80866 RepID=UPI001C0DC8F0|nr:hypothetical protein [Delftia acidovorans]MCA1066835.1 hypothetical protein [Delftia acidovorans]
MNTKATNEDLDKLVKVLIAGTRLKLGHASQLDDGRYISHSMVPAKSGKKWAISIYKNLLTPGNDIEISIDPTPLAWPYQDKKQLEKIRKWLEAQRDLENLPSKNHLKNQTRQQEHFRIGLTLDGALTFVCRLQEQLSLPINGQPWNLHSHAEHMISKEATLGTVAIEQTIDRMFRTVQQTCEQSGSTSIATAKDKQFSFSSEEQFRDKLRSLLSTDQLRCALTRVPLDPADSTSDLAPSLDRIDSEKHYEPANLQIVAKFANRWKSNDSDENFKYLLDLIRKN